MFLVHSYLVGSKATAENFSSHVLFTLTNRNRSYYIYHWLTGSAFSAFHVASAKARARARGTGPKVFLFLYENPRRVTAWRSSLGVACAHIRRFVERVSPRKRGRPQVAVVRREDQVQSPASRPPPASMATGTNYPCARG